MIKRKRPGDPAREQSWREHLRQFAAGGQTVRQFCAARQLTEPSFYYWRSEIRRRDGQAPPREQRASPRSADALGFARILVARPGVTDCLRVCLKGGRELLLPTSMAPEQVARLVHALEATS
jgi:hypothetical protein